jgi:hypothetical protein
MSTKNPQDEVRRHDKLEESQAALSRLDGLLASEEALVPSSGFLASVMERVEDEMRMPEPIPFPWKRALPGFVLAAGAACWGAVEFVRLGVPAIRAGVQAEISAPAIHLPAFHAAGSGSTAVAQAGWVAMAVAVSAASWVLARVLVGRSRVL